MEAGIIAHLEKEGERLGGLEALGGKQLDLQEAQLQRNPAGEPAPLCTFPLAAPPHQGFLTASECHHLNGHFTLPPPRAAGVVVLKTDAGKD